MPAYVAFGLRIHSERELPDGVQLASDHVEREPAAPDVTIRLAPAQGTATPSSEGALDGWYEFAPERHRFGWPEVGSVEIERGRDVLVRPLTDVAEGLVEHVLLGPVMADILLSRGLVPLHASASCVEGGAVAFVGRSGQGKSTLAAALHRKGQLAHADDLLAVPVEVGGTAREQDTHGVPEVPFGISRIKLNPDSALSTGENPDGMPPVYAGVAKRSKVILWTNERPALPLRAIYRVLDGDEIAITKLDPRKALFEVYRNCFRVEVEQHAVGIAELLRRCASVATRVPCFDLVRPRDLARLEAVAAAVVEHARALPS
jgi:hypothetical protein